MGCYSDLAIDNDACALDASITTPEQQLLWRLDDLRDRLNELKISGALYGGVCRYTKSDLRYAPTGYFSTICDVETAIELAIEDLKNQYGIEASQDPSLQEIVIFSPYCVMQTVYRRQQKTAASDATVSAAQMGSGVSSGPKRKTTPNGVVFYMRNADKKILLAVLRMNSNSRIKNEILAAARMKSADADEIHPPAVEADFIQRSWISSSQTILPSR